MKIEELLSIHKYGNNIEGDPNWDFFPLRTSYHEELLRDVEIENAKHVLQDIKSVGPLKKSREEKRLIFFFSIN